MALITKPYTWEAFATKAGEAAEVNANFDLLYGDYNGNILDANLSAVANIQQSKILNLTGDLNVIRATKVGSVTVQAFGAAGGFTYTKPAGLLFARIIVIGAGGGGGSAQSVAGGASSGGGGGSGSYTEAWFVGGQINPTENVTIGTGGAGGLGPGPTNGQVGSNSAFGFLIGATGGQGGIAVANSIGAGGAGGAGGGGLNLSGQPGFPGFITTAPTGLAVGGIGGWLGPYMIGGQPFATASSISGVSGSNGGGGAGGASAGVNQADGGAGGAGFVMVVEFKTG